MKGDPGGEGKNPSDTPLTLGDFRSQTLLFTVDIDSQGSYVIDLAPAKYTIDLKPNGIDHTSDLPQVVEIRANTVTRVDVSIDTGIR